MQNMRKILIDAGMSEKLIEAKLIQMEEEADFDDTDEKGIKDESEIVPSPEQEVKFNQLHYKQKMKGMPEYIEYEDEEVDDEGNMVEGNKQSMVRHMGEQQCV
jgi:hypothetical protein